MMTVVTSQSIRVTVAESLIRDLDRVGEWCDLWGMKLNANKTKTMTVSKSHTMHPQSPPLTIGRTVLKESDDLVILGWERRLITKLPLRSIFASFLEQLFKDLVSWSLRKSWQVFHDRSLLERCFRGFVLPVFEYYSAVWCSAADKTPYTTGPCSQ